jgi:putative membrane protein
VRLPASSPRVRVSISTTLLSGKDFAMFRTLAFTVALLALSSLSFAEEKAQTLAKKDQQFISGAASGGMLEVELGKLAADKAQSEDVKKFAQQMVTDHTKANDELKTLAQGKGATLPTEMMPRHKKDLDRLSKLSGADFDKAYMTMMVKDHEEDVNQFKEAARNSADPDLKSFADKTVPTLEEHLKMAKETHKAVLGHKES